MSNETNWLNELKKGDSIEVKRLSDVQERARLSETIHSALLFPDRLPLSALQQIEAIIQEHQPK